MGQVGHNYSLFLHSTLNIPRPTDIYVSDPGHHAA